MDIYDATSGSDSLFYFLGEVFCTRTTDYCRYSTFSNNVAANEDIIANPPTTLHDAVFAAVLQPFYP